MKFAAIEISSSHGFIGNILLLPIWIGPRSPKYIFELACFLQIRIQSGNDPPVLFRQQQEHRSGVWYVHVRPKFHLVVSKWLWFNHSSTCYACNRRQRVKVNGSFSSTRDLAAGIPQGAPICEMIANLINPEWDLSRTWQIASDLYHRVVSTRILHYNRNSSVSKNLSFSI